MSYTIARAQVRDSIDRAERFMRTQLSAAAGKPGLRQRERRRLAQLASQDPPGVTLSLGRHDVVAAHGTALADALYAHWQAHAVDPGFRYWLGTFCWDAGVVPLGEYLSSAAIAAMTLKVYKALRAHHVHAVICAEVDVLVRPTHEGGSQLLYHVHAVCWRYGAPIKPQLLAQAIMQPGRFPNRLGAPAVVFTTNAWPKVPVTTDMTPPPPRRGRAPLSAASVMGLGWYVTKGPFCAKVLRPDLRRPGHHHLVADQSKLTPRLALALVEARSRLRLLAAVRGLGDGAGVRAAWRRQLLAQLLEPG